MSRYAAFLRAVNVGGHTIKMTDLRAAIEELGFDDVKTFIASGNVIFDSTERDEGKLERTIERTLEATFGFPIETFVRSMSELTEIASRDPFDRKDPQHDGRSIYVAFLGRRPTDEAVARLVALATKDDTFAVVDREAYWLRRGGIGTSPFASGFLEKTIGLAATLRGVPTITRIIAKFG